MASFLKAVIRLATKSEPQSARPGVDEEQGRLPAPDAAPQERRHFGQFLQSHLGFGHHQSQYPVPDNESLILYRLLLGISSSAHLGFDQDAAGGWRPAANIGIYARVVHEEQKSKDSFKVFTVIINACYFLQIIIAAALTALGAANADNKVITAFGAFNTITAGLLTFLKGSGLPARYKYYGNEWKKIREFIEQRERDFSRANCTLDVYQVVDTIERMYTHTKQEIEVNTPDSYTSVSRSTGQMGIDSSGKIGGIDISKLEGLASTITGLDGAVSNITAGLKDKTHSLTQDIHEHAKEMEEHKAFLEREARAKLDVGKHAVSSSAQQAQERVAEGARQAQQTADEVRDEAQRTEMALRESQAQMARMGGDLTRQGQAQVLRAGEAAIRSVSDVAAGMADDLIDAREQDERKTQ